METIQLSIDIVALLEITMLLLVLTLGENILSDYEVSLTEHISLFAFAAIHMFERL